MLRWRWRATVRKHARENGIVAREGGGGRRDGGKRRVAVAAQAQGRHPLRRLGVLSSDEWNHRRNLPRSIPQGMGSGTTPRGARIPRTKTIPSRPASRAQCLAVKGGR
mmetsp:Transcript_2915/g.7003  ORF Transcript_2915/g.7003 Transcript_2915/m.7003 type:complete len:108 (-) Transcript_2915:91-414(-)